MAGAEIPKQLQDQIEHFQALQNQVMMLSQQRQQYEAQTKELERANTALAGLSDDATVYKSVGAFLIKTPGKVDAVKEISDESETLGVRLKNVERQESRLKEQVTELQSKIENGLARMRGQAAPHADADDEDED